jgi:hypothetical protein
MKKNNLLLNTCWSILCFSILLSGCEPDEGGEAEKAPQIPPVSTFMADFSFPANKDDVSNGRLNGEYDHWTFAAANVVIWQSVLTLNLAIPVIAFHESR